MNDTVKTHELKSFTVAQLSGKNIKVPPFQRYQDTTNKKNLWQSICDIGILRPIILSKDIYSDVYTVIDGNHLRNALIFNASKETKVPVLILNQENYLDGANAFIKLNNIGKPLDEVDYTQFHAQKPMDRGEYYKFMWEEVYCNPKTKQEALKNIGGKDDVFSPEAVRYLFSNSSVTQVRNGEAKLRHDYKQRLDIYQEFKEYYFEEVEKHNGCLWRQLDTRFRKAALVEAINVWMSLYHKEQISYVRDTDHPCQSILHDIGEYTRDVQRRCPSGQSANKQFINTDFKDWMVERSNKYLLSLWEE